ncbi:MAG: hypothetical protein WEA77_12810 [Hyphomonas sp.]|uniref:hypothetical protein n=1 Tax=Hyphomonas sp. TaxID=87 RepID=UPI0034A00591
MKTFIIVAALLGSVSLTACDERASAPQVPAPRPERSVEPVEEETPPAVETPAPYVDDMGGGLGNFREENDALPADPVTPPAAPDEAETPPTVPPT